MRSRAPPLRRIARDAIAVLKRDTGGDVDRLRQSVEVWFNDSMERMSGWYKRRTQIVSLLCAIVVTIGTNADTLTIAGALWRDPTMRQAVVAQAQRYVAEQPQAEAQAQAQGQVAAPGAPEPPALPPFEQAQVDFDAASNRLDASLADLNAMQLPIGWRDRADAADNAAVSRFRLVRDDATEAWPGVIWNADDRARWLAALDAHTLGWLITILAISLGAPFWFDMLNKIIVDSQRGQGARGNAPCAERRAEAARARRGALTRFNEGDAVQTPFGKGVVREVRNNRVLLVDVQGRALVVSDADVTALDATGGGSCGPAESRGDPSFRDRRGSTRRPSRSAWAPAEIDLHGLTVEDALARAESALNDALLANAEALRFIHGRSGGRIRAALHRRLRELPGVRFHVDPRNEGVTIVEL